MKVRYLVAVPNTAGDVCKLIIRKVALPAACCPVSKNPMPQSNILIVYQPQALLLEVKHLVGYLQNYVGGWRDETGTLVVRDMEGMLAKIAQDCANVVRVPVLVIPLLKIHPIQELGGLFYAQPQED
jgi:hypothetical protein